MGPNNPFPLGPNPFKEYFWRHMRKMYESTKRGTNTSMVVRLLEAKFGVIIPRPAQSRLRERSDEELEQLAVKILTASTIEELGLEV